MSPSTPALFWSALRGEPVAAEAWPGIVARARREGVLPYLAARHASMPGRQELRRAAAAEHLDRVRLMGAVRSVLSGAAIPWVVLKGLALAHGLYDDPVERPSGDCDILVRHEDRAHAASALEAAGFHPAPHHRELFTGAAGQVDLHTAFVNTERVTGRVAVGGERPGWERRAVQLETPDGPIPALGEEDLAAYLVLHLVHHHGGAGARWILDLARLVERRPRAVETIRDLGAAGRLSLALAGFLGANVARPGGRLDRLVLQAAWEGESLPGMRFLLSLREMPGWGERLRFARQILVPDPGVLASAAHAEHRSPLVAHLARLFATVGGLGRLSLHLLRGEAP